MKVKLVHCFKLKCKRVWLLQRASARTHAGILKMRFCSCALASARLFMKRCWHIKYFLNLLDVLHRLSLSLAFYDNFDCFIFLFSFCLRIFYPKIEHIKIIVIFSSAIPVVLLLISSHWKKKRVWVILINFEALTASQRRTLVYSRTIRIRKILTIS